MFSKWLFFLVINGYFIADLTDAMASSFSDSMVVSERLLDVVSGDWLCIGAHDLFASLSENLAPRLDTVVANTLSNIVSVQAHPRNESFVELLVRFTRVLNIFGDCEEASRAKTRCISDLRPVI